MYPSRQDRLIEILLLMGDAGQCGSDPGWTFGNNGLTEQQYVLSVWRLGLEWLRRCLQIQAVLVKRLKSCRPDASQIHASDTSVKRS